MSFPSDYVSVDMVTKEALPTRYWAEIKAHGITM